MAESPPPGGGAPPKADDAASEPKKGESDPLFNPPNMKTRKTVMGLAPAPHLVGASPRAAEAEARRQRVLARIAAMEAGKATPTETAGRPGSHPPPPAIGSRPGMQPALASRSPSQPVATFTGPPPAYSNPTTTMATPDVPLTLPRTQSSDNKLPVAAGWEVHEVASAQEMKTEVMEAAPNTARLLRAAPMVNVPPARQAPPREFQQTVALAVRPWEPPNTRHALSGALDERLVMLTEPASPRATGFRLLRDGLIAKGMPRVLAVSSAAPHDGKTTCACNLALALAEQAGTRVLLLDANFFSFELATIFMIERLGAIGTAADHSWLSPYRVVEVKVGLHVGGVVKGPGPTPRFDQQRFDAMVERMVRVSYDYIILDTPALRGSPAVAHLLATADATLLAVRAGVTTTRDLRKAVEAIPKDKALGVALVDGVT